MNKRAGLSWIVGTVLFLSACSQSPEERQRVEQESKRGEVLRVVSTYFDNARKIVVIHYTEGGRSDKPDDVKEAASKKIEQLFKAEEPFLDENIDISYRVRARHIIEQALLKADRNISDVAIDLGEPQIDNMRAQAPVYVNNRICNVFLRNPGDSWKIYKVECEPLY